MMKLTNTYKFNWWSIKQCLITLTPTISILASTKHLWAKLPQLIWHHKDNNKLSNKKKLNRRNLLNHKKPKKKSQKRIINKMKVRVLLSHSWLTKIAIKTNKLLMNLRRQRFHLRILLNSSLRSKMISLRRKIRINKMKLKVWPKKFPICKSQRLKKRNLMVMLQIAKKVINKKRLKIKLKLKNL